METLTLILVLGVIRAVMALVEHLNSRPAAGEPLCGRCAFAHIEHRDSGRRDLYCGVGGGLRKLRGVISFCTSFTVRAAPRERGPVGFVPVENLRPALPENTD